MGTVRVQRDFKLADVRCDATQIGDFVDFLRSYVEEAIAEAIDTRTAGRRSELAQLSDTAPDEDRWREERKQSEIASLERLIAADEDDLKRFIAPRWKVTTRIARHDRQIDVAGDYSDVADTLDLPRARFVSVTLGAPNVLPQFRLRMTRNSGATLTVESDDHRWIDRESPLVQSRLNALGRTPLRHVPRAPLAATAFVLGIGGILAASSTNDALRAASLVVAVIAVASMGVSFVPALRVGPKPPSRLWRAAAWFGGTLITAAIGAVVGKLLFP